ncbi:hypothetical protein [Streptomyces sp. 4F14]|uniref:hypothetical protein n=1 Tax=Streptomyces sp. 4F14 TaxID=3394380 RepID=UPI003A84FB92
MATAVPEFVKCHLRGCLRDARRGSEPVPDDLDDALDRVQRPELRRSNLKAAPRRQCGLLARLGDSDVPADESGVPHAFVVDGQLAGDEQEIACANGPLEQDRRRGRLLHEGSMVKRQGMTARGSMTPT